MSYFKVHRKNITIMLVVLAVFMLAAVSVSAQTPAPPTSAELVTDTLEGMNTNFPIVPVAMLASVMIGLILWVARRFLKFGR